jgi:hypothetical protein
VMKPQAKNSVVTETNAMIELLFDVVMKSPSCN